MQARSKTLKSARLKSRRRKIAIGKIAAAIFCAAVLWGLAFWLSGLPSVNISEISVSGNVSVPSSDIAAEARKFLDGRYFFTVPKSNILFYPKSAIAKAVLNSFPIIESASAGRKNFHAIEIKIAERSAAAFWCRKDSGCFPMDSGGFVFAAEDFASATPALIEFYGPLASSTQIVGQTYRSADYLKKRFDFAKNLSSAGFSAISFTERADGASEAALAGGQRLIFTDDTDLSAALANLQSLVSDPSFKSAGNFAKLDYIDLRFGNKVFYKLRNSN